MRERSPKTPVLGADDVIRFSDPDHFLDELAGRLGSGRAYVRTSRSLPMHEPVELGLEAPVVGDKLWFRARVVYAGNGHLGLEIEGFDRLVIDLDQLGERVEQLPQLRAPSSHDLLRAPTEPGAAPPDATARTAMPPPEGDAPPPAHPPPPPMSQDVEAALAAFLSDGDGSSPGPGTPETTPEPATAPLRAAPDPAPAHEAPPTGSRLAGALAGALPPRPPSDGSHPSGDLSADAEAEAPPTRRSVIAPPAPSDDVEEAADATTEVADAAEAADATTEAADATTEATDATTEAADATTEAADATTEAADATTEAADATEGGPTADEEDAATGGPDAAPMATPDVAPEDRDGASDDLGDPLETLALVRATRNGVVRLTEPSELLGVWLSQLSRGFLTLHGGPDGERGTRVRLKIAAHRVVAIEGLVADRSGPWLTVRFGAPPEPVRALVVEAGERWWTTLAILAPPSTAPPGSAASSPASSPPEAPDREPPRTGPDPDAAPLSNLSLEVGPRSSLGLRGVEALVPLPQPDDPQTEPRPPTLDGHRVHFRHAVDLQAETRANLVNGGLFVASEPLPLRERMTLELMVGDVRLPLRIDAEVVFAQSGKLGFSIRDAQHACAQIQRFVTDGVPSKPEGERPPSFEAPAEPPPAVELLGRLEGPPSPEQMLKLPTTDGLEGPRTALGVFFELVRREHRGVLQLTGPGGERRIYLHQGNVAYMETVPFEEDTALGRLLVRHRRLTEPALREGLDVARSNSALLGRTLFSLGHVKAGDIVSALREQARARLEAALDWPEGHFELQAWAEPPGEGELVVTRGIGILAHHVKSRFEACHLDELQAMLGPMGGEVLHATPELDTLAKPLGLAAKDLRFLQISLDGRRSLSDVLSISGLGRLKSLRLVATGLALGVVEKLEGKALTRATSGLSGRMERNRRELADKWRMMQDQTHFEVLGVHWTSHPRSFQEAYEAKLAEFSLVKGPFKDAPDEIRETVGKLVARVKEAFEVLDDRRQRVQYRMKHFDNTERSYAAQMLVDKAELALIRGAIRSAIELLETADELSSSDKIRALLDQARTRLRMSG